MIKTITIAALTLGLTCMAQAQPRTHRGQRLGGDIRELKSYLGLTDSQAESIRNARRQQRDGMQPAVQELKSKQQALKGALDSGRQDPNEIGRLTLEARAARQKMMDARKASAANTASMLTPEQRSKLEALKSGGRENRGAARAAARMGLLEGQREGRQPRTRTQRF